MLDVALAVCSRQSDPILDTDEYLDSKMVLKPPVTNTEWEVLGHATSEIYNTKQVLESNNGKESLRPIFRQWDASACLLPNKAPTPLDAFLVSHAKEEPKNTRVSVSRK